jgi:hypothetical protein
VTFDLVPKHHLERQFYAIIGASEQLMADNADHECTQPDDLRVRIEQLAALAPGLAAHWTQARASFGKAAAEPVTAPLYAQNLTVPNLPRALRA